ncbi:thioredoxin-like protein [Phlebopus sp. FC_14]|nr:thioredoxin-like protein [Phlebopus sp. FC_14]
MSDTEPAISPDSPRLLKIIVISDYICAFCYIASKALHDAIAACNDLPIRFDVEYRPFTLMCPTAQIPGSTDSDKKLSRKAYLVKKLGQEHAEAKWKLVSEMAQKVGLAFADDGIVCRSTQAHRLAVKAYQVGGQKMQTQLNNILFHACFSKGEDISEHDFLADAAVKVGLMTRQKALEFLNSTECQECVDKMVQAARANSVNGVPFIMIDGKWALNGVQATECYIQIFRKLAQSTISPTPSGMSTACSDCNGPLVAPTVSVQ